MNIRLLINNKQILTILIIIGMVAGIFFLPLNLKGKYTCLYHQLIDNEGALLSSGYVVKESLKPEDGVHTKNERQVMHSRALLNIYLSRYAFIWWSSLALTAFCIFRLRHTSA